MRFLSSSDAMIRLANRVFYVSLFILINCFQPQRAEYFINRAIAGVPVVDCNPWEGPDDYKAECRDWQAEVDRDYGYTR